MMGSKNAYFRGCQLASLRRFRDAIGEFGNALSGDENDFATLAEIAICHLRLLNFAEARRAAEDSLRANSQSPRAYYALGSALFYDAKFKSRRPGDCPRNADRLTIQAHRLRLAASATDAGLTLQPRDANLLLLKAQISFEAMAPDEATRTVDAGLAISPQSPAFLRMRAIILQSFGDTTGAITASSAALRLDPRDAQSHHVAGWSALFASQYDLAFQHFIEALRIDPTSVADRRSAAFALKAAWPVYRPVARLSLRLRRLHKRKGALSLVRVGMIVFMLALLFSSGITRIIDSTQPEQFVPIMTIETTKDRPFDDPEVMKQLAILATKPAMMPMPRPEAPKPDGGFSRLEIVSRWVLGAVFGALGLSFFLRCLATYRLLFHRQGHNLIGSIEKTLAILGTALIAAWVVSIVGVRPLSYIAPPVISFVGLTAVLGMGFWLLARWWSLKLRRLGQIATTPDDEPPLNS